jgi:ATP-dependent DNA helicase RecG
MEKTNNGFVIAQEDLRIRGAGDIVGLKQSGLSDTALQGLVDQEELLVYARNSAKQLVDTNPELEGLARLQNRIKQRSANVMANAG